MRMLMGLLMAMILASPVAIIIADAGNTGERDYPG